MSKLRLLAARLWRGLRSPALIFPALVISITSGAIALNANAAATRGIEDQNIFLRDTFCILVVPFGYSGTPTTPGGLQIQESFRTASSRLQCNIDDSKGEYPVQPPQ